MILTKARITCFQAWRIKYFLKALPPCSVRSNSNRKRQYHVLDEEDYAHDNDEEEAAQMKRLQVELGAY